MRTTLSIADDVLFAVKEIARRQKRTAGDVLSDLARKALSGGVQNEVRDAEEIYGFEAFPKRGPAVSNELIDRLREEEQE